MNNIQTNVETITPEKARDLLKMNTCNVPLKKKMVDYYATQMKAGKWRLTSQGITISNSGTIIDGQHRLAAIVQSDTTQQMLVIRGLEHEEVFNFYDTGRTRTIGDVLSTYDIKNSNQIAAAILRYFLLQKSHTMSSDAGPDRKRSGKTVNDFVDVYNVRPELWDLITKKVLLYHAKLRIIKPGETIAYMFYLINDKKHPETVVFDFFEQLYGVRITENKSILLLRDKLINEKIRGERISNKTKQALIIKSWNNYILKRDLERLVYVEKRERMPDFI